MRCAVSESLQLKFLAKMTGDISAMQKAGEPFSVKNYTRALYDEILKKTGDQIKAQTFATYVPQNLLTILSVDKDFRTYLKPYMQEFTDLIDQFEDYDFVGVYLNVGQDALKEKEEDTVSTNIASLEYVPAPGEYELSQQEPEAVSGIEGFKQAYGKSILSTQGYERDRDGNVITDPVVLNSFAFVKKLDRARANGFLDNPELEEIKLKAVLAKSIMSELSGADRYYESSSSESGVKLIFVDSKGNPIRVDSEGNISDVEGSIIPQFNIVKPLLENGKFSRKIDESAEVLAKEFKTTPEEIEKSRQEDYRKVYALRNLLLANPNSNVYLDISGSTSGFVNIDYKNPIRLSEINFNVLGIKFKPEVDPSGKGYFIVPQTSQKLQIDKPKISDVIDPVVLSKFIFDTNVDLETRKSVYEKLLYVKDLRLKPEGVSFKGQPITEEGLVSLLNSTTISERGVVSPLYRANIHKKTLDTNSNIDIPFYENGQVDYKSMNIVDYVKTYFNTPAQLTDDFKPTNPYVTFSVPNELNLELAAFLEKNISFESPVTTELEPKKADIERRRQEELKKFGTSEKKTSKYNIKLLGINEYVSRELMELAYSNDWGRSPWLCWSN